MTAGVKTTVLIPGIGSKLQAMLGIIRVIGKAPGTAEPERAERTGFAIIEFFTTHKVECCDGAVHVDGDKLAKPLLLQADDLV
jgi:hypothetical protein